MTNHVLFIHGGGGEGAYTEDGFLVASLQKALGAAYEVHYPKMPLEDSATYPTGNHPCVRWAWASIWERFDRGCRGHKESSDYVSREA